MYLCYVDESGDPGPKGSTHLVLTGAALFEGKWRHLREDLDRITAVYWPVPPRPTEFHLNELQGGKGAFRSLTPVDRERLKLDLCQVATRLLDSELRVFTVIADKSEWFSANPAKTGDDLYLDLFEQLSSRFDLFLRRRHAEGFASKGIIIADPHKQQLSRTLKAFQRTTQKAGNRWSPIYNLIETVFFLDSQESPGLQLADLFSYAVWRLVVGADTGLAGALGNCFDREPLYATTNAGKWHGVKCLSSDPALLARISSIWR